MDSTARTSSIAPLSRAQGPRLVIIDEHTSVADVLDVGLWGQYRVRSVTTSRQTSIAATVATARSTRPDVAIVSCRPGPFVDDDAVIAGLTAAGVPVIALCPVAAETDPVHWGRCLLAGAVGVLAMTDGLAVLRRMLELVLTGQPPLCPAVAIRLRELAQNAATDERWAARARLGSLSARERQVVGRLVTGRGPIEIAREDVVAEATVRSQVKSILAKLGVSSQVGAVAVAHLAGWPTTEDGRHAA